MKIKSLLAISQNFTSENKDSDLSVITSRARHCVTSTARHAICYELESDSGTDLTKTTLR